MGPNFAVYDCVELHGDAARSKAGLMESTLEIEAEGR